MITLDSHQDPDPFTSLDQLDPPDVWPQICDRIAQPEQRHRPVIAVAAALTVLIGAAAVAFTQRDTGPTVIQATATPATDPAQVGVRAWSPAVDLIVFLWPEAGNDDRDAVAEALADDARVESVEFIDQTQTLAEFQEIFADEPGLIANVTADDLPTSFRVTVRDPDTAAELRDDYRYHQGVREILLRQPEPGTPSTAGTGIPTTTIAPMPASDLARAIIADGIVELDEFRQALDAAVACARQSGIEVTIDNFSAHGDFGYTTNEEPGGVVDLCFAKHVNPLGPLFATTPTPGAP